MRLHIRFRARSLPDTIKDHRLIRFLVQQLHQSGHSFGWNEHSVEKNRKAGLETHGTNTGQNTLMDFHYQVLACPDFHKKRNKTAFSENRKTASKTIHTVPFPQKTPLTNRVDKILLPFRKQSGYLWFVVFCSSHQINPVAETFHRYGF